MFFLWIVDWIDNKNINNYFCTSIILNFCHELELIFFNWFYFFVLHLGGLQIHISEFTYSLENFSTLSILFNTFKPISLSLSSLSFSLTCYFISVNMAITVNPLRESETTSGWNWKMIRGGEGEARACIKSLSIWTSWHLVSRTWNFRQ